jgi:ComF family protein
VHLVIPLQSRIRNVPEILSSCISLASRPFLDVLFPRVCLVCGLPLPVGGLSLCAVCMGGLTRVAPDDELFQEMLAKLQAGGVIDDLFVPFYFEREEPIRALVHELKYNGMKRIGVELGREIGRCLLGEGVCRDIDVVMPVPLHRARLRERGYNQSDCLCQGISEVTGVPPLHRVLTRRRNTASQTALSAAERVSNVADAFAARAGTAFRVRGSGILLVDDVITTGATVRACASVLRSFGAGSVHAASAALAC